MTSPIDLSGTETALAEYDRTQAQRDEMFNACKTNADVALWQEAERTARVAVTRVFVSETRNSPDKADIIGLEFVRTILGKWQRGEIRE